MKPFIVRAVALFFFSRAMASGQQTDVLCRVFLRVVNTEGAAEPYGLVHFTSKAGNNRASVFRRLEGIVPCGSYDYTVRRTDITSPVLQISGHVDLNTSEKDITLVSDPTTKVSNGQAYAEDSFPPPARLGHISGMHDGEGYWIGVKSVFGNFVSESRVDAAGNFKLYNLPWRGLFIVFVTDSAGEIVYVSALKGSAAISDPWTINLFIKK